HSGRPRPGAAGSAIRAAQRRPFGHQSREADDFIATSRSEDVVVLLPESRLGLGLNRLAIVGGLTGPRFFSRSIGLLVWLAGRAVYAHALMFVLRGPLAGSLR